MLQKLSKSYPPQFELLPLGLLFLNVYLTLTSYPSLPEKVPTHFNFVGLPDAWGGRDSILFTLIVGAATYAVFTVINILMAVSRDPRRFINLPNVKKAALNAAQIEELRHSVNRSLLAMKLSMQGMFLYISYITIEIALKRADRLGIPFFLTLGAILLPPSMWCGRAFVL